jgi:hypothetical protein
VLPYGVGTTPTYSAHARERMARRGIGEAEVAGVLAAPRATDRDPRGNRRLTGVVGGRVIVVVVAAGSVPPHVVTVWDRGSV